MIPSPFGVKLILRLAFKAQLPLKRLLEMLMPPNQELPRNSHTIYHLPTSLPLQMLYLNSRMTFFPSTLLTSTLKLLYGIFWDLLRLG